MKLVSLKSKFVVAAPLAIVGIFGASHLVMAQPNAAAAGKGQRGRRAKGGMTPKVQQNIETALGKPLTDDQKTQLNAAAKEQRQAVAEAQEKFNDEVAKVTGLPIETVRGLKKNAGAGRAKAAN